MNSNSSTDNFSLDTSDFRRDIPRETLSRLSIDNLRRFIGKELVEMLDNDVYRMTLAADLAEVLLLKDGYDVLGNREIREALIDSLSAEKVSQMENLINKIDGSYQDFYTYFKTWTTSKSDIFVKILGWSDAFKKNEIKDSRGSYELATCNFGEKVVLRGYLHPYQKIIKDKISSSLKQSSSRAMVQMPTGSGKTFTALETFVDLLRQPRETRQRYLVWLVNKPDLAEQALKSFEELWKIKGDRPIKLWRFYNQWGGPPLQGDGEEGIVFCTYDKLYEIIKRKSEDSYRVFLKLAESTQYLIVDEAHMSVAETYSTIIHAFSTSFKAKLVGLSATPYRDDTDEYSELLQMYRRNIIAIDENEKGESIDNAIAYLQEQKYLAKVEMIPFETKVHSEETNEEKLLRELSRIPSRNLQITRLIKEADESKEKTMVFGCTREHVILLRMLCRKEGINSKIILGETSPIERQEIFDQFKDKESDLYVLINLEILSTGIDLPNIEKIILARPVKSPTLYSQMIGRALRGPKNGGNEKNKIINIIDNLAAYGDINTLYNSFMNDWT